MEIWGERMLMAVEEHRGYNEAWWEVLNRGGVVGKTEVQERVQEVRSSRWARTGKRGAQMSVAGVILQEDVQVSARCRGLAGNDEGDVLHRVGYILVIALVRQG